ncbi:CdaR family transcriptional regulator [Gorillibacterium sp. sgz500922]|uniref:CdaR family transcriptional regulator n=1 Tax=Gorillibacterium sp. sgz500922 TaxID=3446694 RepID=UPI003F67110A
MFQISEKQAQEIVDKMMQDIPYSINIMNERGIIVGSGKKERIGTVHQGAVRALTTGEMVEVWEDSRTERKGTNEPIVIAGKRVGVIGITGNPDEVRPFCNLVRTTVSLLIEQRIALESQANAASRKKAFLEMLLNHRGPYSHKLAREAAEYGLNLHLKTTALVVRQLKPDSGRWKLPLQTPSFPLEEGSLLVLLQNAQDPAAIRAELAASDTRVLVTSGLEESRVADSYQQAAAAMKILLALKPPVRTAAYAEVEFLVKLSRAELTEGPLAAAKLADAPDLLETLRSFIYYSGSVQHTSEALNIHRNTLQYRLKRIHALTGKDPRNLLELFELTHGLLALFK